MLNHSSAEAQPLMTVTKAKLQSRLVSDDLREEIEMQFKESVLHALSSVSGGYYLMDQ